MTTPTDKHECSKCHGNGVDKYGDECPRCDGWGTLCDHGEHRDCDDDPSWDAHK